ncbi:hypothetical protein [Collimonas humicola]|uniref:hypothetical protein n=1 Tax=Collimonas humicola TaxID=2825886 RepID=UPI001B8D43F2|nr:hypothetical protein [Collimonas humicola]
MYEALVVLSGLIAGCVQWLPCGIGLAAHRYKLGGAIIKSTNKWILLGARPTSSFSTLGQVGFAVLMLSWLCVFFGAMAIPAFVARFLGVPEASPFVLYAIYANFFIAVVSFVSGPAIWRRLAL